MKRNKTNINITIFKVVYMVLNQNKIASILQKQ
jgi:hypothetical protein